MTHNPTMLPVDAAAGNLIGDSAAIREVRALVARLGPSGLSILIEGPTGVGKELIAQALHQASGRSGQLIAVNVCAIPDAMFESLLFGHVRGAFTGAITDHVGHLTEAHRGTLFLDEIGELPPQLQPKLLRALETRMFRKVGSHHDQVSDFRLVVATNADLERAVADGRFRADLAFRFGAAVIRVPPLRERVEDVPALAAHFAGLAVGHARMVSHRALHVLMTYPWPGNVRELRHVIELACALSEAGPLDADAVTTALRLRAGPTNSHEEHASQPNIQERQALVQCLERHGWHVPSVAREIGVTKKTVYARIQRLGISIPGRYRRRAPPEPTLDLRSV